VAWRCGVVIFAVLAVVQFAIEGFNASLALQIGVASEPLFNGGILRERGPTTFRVESIPAASPLAAAGVVPGDGLRFDDPIGRWHGLAAGDRVALSVFHGSEVRRIDVTVPAATALPRHRVANYLLGTAQSLFALLLGVVVGWRRPDLVTYRALAAAGLMNGFIFPYWAPAAFHVEWLDFIASLSQELGPAMLVLFALNYPDDKPVGLRASFRRYYPWLFGLLIVVEIIYFARLYSGYFEPALTSFFGVSQIALGVLFFWAILLAWRQAQGESRIRLQWILATIGTIVAVFLIGALNYLSGNPIPPEDLSLVQNGAAFAAEIGLAYAILRRRIFDFGLAVNRTLVFGIVGAILLAAFQVANAVVSQFLHFDDKYKTTLLSAILAVAVYLSFNQLKKVVEQVVDRVFFGSWAASDQDLKAFVAQAKQATDADALATLFVAALDRFTEGARCALFIRRGAAFVRSEATLADVPDDVGVNDEAVLAMLADRKALRLRDSTSSIRAALAVPMANRGGLFGFVLLGARPDGAPYRTDQIATLEYATRELGLDLYALQLERLAEEAAAERRTSETLRAQLQTAMALAKRGPQEG
jgi:hypothetical protein